MNRKRVVASEVARLAGVSHMTVSRVLNKFPHVKESTRQKVLAVCHKLNYRPNMIAVTLRCKRSRAIGVIIPTFQHTYYARFLNAAEELCRRKGYHIIAIQGYFRDQRFPGHDDLNFLLARQIDGLLIDAVLNNELLSRLKQEAIPTVFFDLAPKNPSFSFVGTDDFAGARELTGYLLNLGHRRIAFLTGKIETYTSERRQAGYRAAFAEKGIPFDRSLVFYADYTTGSGYEETGRLLGIPGISFTAIIGVNDYVAIGSLAALAEKGIKVPEQVSVAGFTGDEIGAYTVPSLTTMVQPIGEIGRRAVEELLARIHAPQRPVEKILLPATLLERRSTARVPKGVAAGVPKNSLSQPE